MKTKSVTIRKMKRKIGVLAVICLVTFSTFLMIIPSTQGLVSIDKCAYDLVWDEESYVYVWLDIYGTEEELTLFVTLYARHKGNDYIILDKYFTFVCEHSKMVECSFDSKDWHSHSESAEMYWLKVKVFGGDTYKDYNIEIRNYSCKVKVLNCPSEVKEGEKFNVTVSLYDYRGTAFMGDIIVELYYPLDREVGRKSSVEIEEGEFVIPCRASVSAGSHGIRALIKDNRGNLIDQSHCSHDIYVKENGGIPAFEFAFLIVAIGIILIKRRNKRNR